MRKSSSHKAVTKVIKADDDTDGYSDFLVSVRRGFEAATTAHKVLFTTNALNLWKTFLETIPADRQAHYDCRACARFVERFGGLVTIDCFGNTKPVMWDPAAVPSFFCFGVTQLRRIVAAAAVTGVFLTEDTSWGLSENADPGRPASEAREATATEPARVAKPATEARTWHHLCVKPDEALVFKSTASTSASQAVAELLVDYTTLDDGLAKYPPEKVQPAKDLLTTAGLYRAEKGLPIATWFLELHAKIRSAHPGAERTNVKWLAVAMAPGGFARYKNNVVATLCDDLAAKKPLTEIMERWAAKLDPQQYGHAQVAPSAGNIRAAELLIEESGVGSALARRYARIADITQFLWQPQVRKVPARFTSTGLFAHITPKEPKPVASAICLAVDAPTVTWVKFARDILGDAVSIEVLVPTTADRFMALVTAADCNAKPILAWDNLTERNPVSWYYAQGGIDGEVRRRVEGAGAQYENVDVRASLVWWNRNDLDIHVICPSGEQLYFNNKSCCGGELDVDMNVRGETTEPVENVRWARGRGARGHYRVFVQNYAFHEARRSATDFRVELEVAGELYTYDGQTRAGAWGSSSDVEIAEFDFVPGQKVSGLKSTLGVTSASGTSWNLAPGSWAQVSGITLSPNLWGEHPQSHHGRHVFVLIADCRDVGGGKARGLQPEALSSDFRAIRSTIEAHVISAKIAGAEEACACGIGMKDGSPWDLTLRVKTKSGTLITCKIDRWE